MGLPKGNGADNARDYLKGAIAGGGLWHALEVLDDAVLQSSVSTLNDVTLTSPNIGAAEWTDAQHTHASAATAGSTLGPGTTLSTPTLQTPAVSGVMTFGGDATLQRTGVGALHQGGGAHKPWAGGVESWQLGPRLHATSGGTDAGLVYNAYFDGSSYRLIGADAASRLYLLGPQLQFQHTGSAAAETAVGWVTRLAVGTTGTLTVTPDTGGGIVVGSSYLVLVQGAVTDGLITSTASVEMAANSGYWRPQSDNNLHLGLSSHRLIDVWAINGTVQTSAAEMKQDITPLDPAAALAAVLATDPVVFDYRPPERDPTYYELPDDPEQAESVLQQRLTSSPLEAAARHQAGFVLQDATGQYQTDPLFETGQGQSNAANSVGVLLAAVRALATRLTALETP